MNPKGSPIVVVSLVLLVLVSATAVALDIPQLGGGLNYEISKRQIMEKINGQEAVAAEAPKVDDKLSKVMSSASAPQLYEKYKDELKDPSANSASNGVVFGVGTGIGFVVSFLLAL